MTSQVKALLRASPVYTYMVPAYAAREYGLPGEGGYLRPYKVLTVNAASDVSVITSQTSVISYFQTKNLAFSDRSTSSL